MKVIYVTRWFSEDMGYIENCLPYAVASLGHEVHIISSTAQVYYDTNFYKETYASFLGDPILPAGVSKKRNVTLHRLPFTMIKNHLVIKGLIKTINSIKPDVVHVFEHCAIDTYRIALNNLSRKYKLFTGNHSVLSVFPLAKEWDSASFLRKLSWNLLSKYPGKLVSKVTEKCFVVTNDAGFIAEKFLGVEKEKIVVSTLGVDTFKFSPETDLLRKASLRDKFGFGEDEAVCIYTGRFTIEKNPLLAARAIQNLNESGFPIKGLFIGEGVQKKDLQQFPACTVVDFVPYPQLPDFYRIADIGIWPSQESTSQLDAVASGVVIILPDVIKAYALTDAGEAETRPKIVGRNYKVGDEESLKSALASLLERQVRSHISQMGVDEINGKYSWLKIAEKRLEDYAG